MECFIRIELNNSHWSSSPIKQVTFSLFTPVSHSQLLCTFEPPAAPPPLLIPQLFFLHMRKGKQSKTDRSSQAGSHLWRTNPNQSLLTCLPGSLGLWLSLEKICLRIRGLVPQQSLDLLWRTYASHLLPHHSLIKRFRACQALRCGTHHS